MQHDLRFSQSQNLQAERTQTLDTYERLLHAKKESELLEREKDLRDREADYRRRLLKLEQREDAALARDRAEVESLRRAAAKATAKGRRRRCQT